MCLASSSFCFGPIPRLRTPPVRSEEVSSGVSAIAEDYGVLVNGLFVSRGVTLSEMDEKPHLKLGYIGHRHSIMASTKTVLVIAIRRLVKLALFQSGREGKQVPGEALRLNREKSGISQSCRVGVKPVSGIAKVRVEPWPLETSRMMILYVRSKTSRHLYYKAFVFTRNARQACFSALSRREASHAASLLAMQTRLLRSSDTGGAPSCQPTASHQQGLFIMEPTKSS